MKDVRRILFALVMIILFPATLFAGAKQEAKAKNFAVGFIPRAFVSVYFVTMVDAAKAEAAKHAGIDLQVVSPLAETDIEGQVKIIEDFIQKRVDLIAVSVNDPKSVVPSVKEAKNAGIPVIILDDLMPLPGVDVLSRIGSNNKDGGVIVGKNVLEIQKKMGRTINMAIIEGTPSEYCNEDRLAGFRSMVTANNRINIVALQPANWERELAMVTMENILQANSDVDIVWGVCDDMVLGALKAVTNAGLNDRIYLLGYDGSKEAVEAVDRGQIYSTILQQPAEIGRMAIKIAEMIRTGKMNEVKAVYEIPIINVKKENAAKWMPER